MFEAVFREAGLPEGLLHVVLGGAEVGEAIVTDPNVTRVSFTGSTAAGRRVGALAGELLKRVEPRARRQQRVRRARRRGPRGGGVGRRVRLVPVPGPGVLRDRPPHRPPQHRRATTSTCWPRRRGRLRLGDPYREDVDLGPIVNQKQLERVDGIVRRSVEAGARVVVGGTHEGLFYRPTVLTDVTTRPGGLARGDLRAGRAGRRVRHRRGGARARQRQRVRADRRGLLALDLARPRARPAVPLGHGPRQRPDRERRGDDPVRRHGRVRHGPLRRPGELGRVHRVAVGDRARRARAPTRSRTERARRWRRSPRSPGSPACRRRPRRASSPRRTTRSAPRPGRACSRPPGRSTTCPTRSRAACSRAGCRSWP